MLACHAASRRLIGARGIRKAVADHPSALRQRLNDPPSLPELARLAGTNVNKLTTGFRQLFGCSVYEFVRAQRLDLAYRLIAAGHGSVAQAAQACGYTDSHFTKVFRQRFGVAPSALR